MIDCLRLHSSPRIFRLWKSSAIHLVRIPIRPFLTIRLPAISTSTKRRHLVKARRAFNNPPPTEYSWSSNSNNIRAETTAEGTGPSIPAVKMDTYNFPEYRLKKKMDDPSKTPLLLVACGSFSPITFLHLRMFVMAADYVKFSTDFEIVGGYLSPVSEAYKKAGLASAEHR